MSDRTAGLRAGLRSLHSDGELLGRFVATRDEEAFAELVRRLGPGVLGVCRRTLGDTPDADDAFQAAFVVLARKAGSIQPRGRVAAWLHGVAVLAARKARAVRGRRMRRERTVEDFPDPPAAAARDADVTPILDAELGRLPDRLRLPILLCDLRDLTVAAAAAELGWPAGTVASRLSRGRALLAARLTRRGVTAAAVAGAAVAVPPSLVNAAVSIAVGLAPAPGAVLSLSTKVMVAMTLSTPRVIAAGLLAAVTLAAGGLALPTPAAPVQPPPPPAAPAAVPAVPPDRLGAVLARVRPTSLNGMLRQPAIREDIALTPEQAPQVELVRARATAELRKQMSVEVQKIVEKVLAAQPPAGGAGAFPAAAMMVDGERLTDMMADHAAGLEKEAFALLTPGQIRRLRQIELQVGGVASLLDRRVIRELRLDAEQEDRIDAIATKRTAAPIPAAATAKAAAKADALLTAGLAVLTPAQRKAWDALVGKPIPTADLVKAGPLSEESMAENAPAVQAAAPPAEGKKDPQ